MLNVKSKGLTTALLKVGAELIKSGTASDVRANTAGSETIRFAEPVCIEIENPRLRHVFLAERNWNKTLPYAESLWIALGWNNLNDLTGRYVKALYNFSDDGITWRGGYGPRIRHFTGSYDQYVFGEQEHGSVDIDMGIDQLQYVIESFKRDKNTRQADITIHDPAKDCFINGELIQTKDTPCTRSLHFQTSPEGKLDMIVRMRSNDILWGFSAVNVFNFTLMQEYVSWMTGIPMGKYYHIADNFHLYTKFVKDLGRILSYDFRSVEILEDNLEEKLNSLEEKTQRNHSLRDFDSFLDLIRKVEDCTYKKDWKGAEAAMSILRKGPSLFNDWAVVLAKHNIKRNKYKDAKKGLYVFKSPYMAEIY